MTDVAARLATLRSESMHILEVGLHAVSSLNIGIVLCNAEGRVLLANPIGQEILRLRDGLELRVDGTLCATQDDADSIPEIIRRVAQRSDQRSSRHTSGVVAVRGAGRRRPLTALIRSVTPWIYLDRSPLGQPHDGGSSTRGLLRGTWHLPFDRLHPSSPDLQKNRCSPAKRTRWPAGQRHWAGLSGWRKGRLRACATGPIIHSGLSRIAFRLAVTA